MNLWPRQPRIASLFKRMALYSSILAASFNVSSCGPEECETYDCWCPEEKWEWNIFEMHSGYDRLFPYDETKRMIYVFTLDTLPPDTFDFTHYQTDTIDRLNKFWEHSEGLEPNTCYIEGDEVERYYYEGISRSGRPNMYARFSRDRTSGSIFYCDFQGFGRNGFEMYDGYALSASALWDPKSRPNYVETHTVLGQDFKDVLFFSDTPRVCEDGGPIECYYNSDQGFIEIIDGCTGQEYRLLDF